MGIVCCRECRASVSSSAKVCPHCGIKRPGPESILYRAFKYGAAGCVLVAVYQCTSIHQQVERESAAVEASLTPEDRARARAAAAEAAERMRGVVERLRALKAAQKNPASFDLVEAQLMDDGTLCAVYRATNSFNAVVTENAAISKSMQMVDWRKKCAGRSGQDFAEARRKL